MNTSTQRSRHKAIPVFKATITVPLMASLSCSPKKMPQSNVAVWPTPTDTAERNMLTEVSMERAATALAVETISSKLL